MHLIWGCSQSVLFSSRYLEVPFVVPMALIAVALLLELLAPGKSMCLFLLLKCRPAMQLGHVNNVVCLAA